MFIRDLDVPTPEFMIRIDEVLSDLYGFVREKRSMMYNILISLQGPCNSNFLLLSFFRKCNHEVPIWLEHKYN